MTDVADEAQRHEQMMRDAALEAHRHRPRPQQESGHVCVSCRDEIEEERRQAVRGTRLCSWCARQIDRGGK